MTPKQKVLKQHPKAYCVAYGRQIFVYKEPAKDQPRGRVQAAVALGSGTSHRHAWTDAARRTKVLNVQIEVRHAFVALLSNAGLDTGTTTKGV